MQNKYAILAALGLLGVLIPLAAPAQVAPPTPPAWRVTSAAVSFVIKNAGFAVDGSFADLRATLAFDPATGSGNLIASVAATSVDTGNKTRDNHLRKEEYFDVARYPRISMRSTNLARQPDGTFVGTFALTIKATTRTLTVPFVFAPSGADGAFAASFPLNRRDFGVGGKSWLLSDALTLSLRVQVAR